MVFVMLIGSALYFVTKLSGIFQTAKVEVLQFPNVTIKTLGYKPFEHINGIYVTLFFNSIPCQFLFPLVSW